MLIGTTYCTMDLKRCSDGSYVGRTGPNCEFSPCPGEPGYRPYMMPGGDALLPPGIIEGPPTRWPGGGAIGPPVRVEPGPGEPIGGGWRTLGVDERTCNWYEDGRTVRGAIEMCHAPAKWLVLAGIGVGALVLFGFMGRGR